MRSGAERAFVAAWLVLATGVYFLDRAARTSTERERVEASALSLAKGVALRPDGDVKRLGDAVAGRVLVLRKVEIEADSGGPSRRLDPESLADKALYDLGVRLARLVRRQAQPTPFEVEALADGRIRAAAPIIVDGRAPAIAIAELPAPRPPDATPIALWLGLSVSFGVGFVFRRPLVMGLAIFALGSMSFGIDGARAAASDAQIQAAAIEANVALSAAGFPAAELTPLPRSSGGALAGVFAAAALVFLAGASGLAGRAFDGLRAHRLAYAYLSPAMVGLGVLTFIPIGFGLGLSVFERAQNRFEFVGLRNYAAILANFDVADPKSFYARLGVTILWTVTNVLLHVTIGLFLALLLNDAMLKARGVFRVLLIIPWAMPNYITALTWKGMFHKEFGAINFVLAALGVEPVSWFQSFTAAFSANLMTNTWLGFPFMMVVSLGALQSIPSDLYEAAWVDGASRWQRFKEITLPLLKPALVPAMIISSVWTFNMFNIIYLVSAGAPDGRTDILVTDAFRWAFERDRYGYAAAYSTLIFGVLLLFTWLTQRGEAPE